MELISEAYRQQQIELHKDPDYGYAGIVFAPVVATLINKFGLEEVLDYGAGKLGMFKALNGKIEHPVRMQAYEPASDDLELRLPPLPSQFVTCVNVLEHVEPEYLDAVFSDLQRVTKQVIFLTIGTKPARRLLPDGRNTHLTIKTPQWWLPRIMQRFELQTYQKTVDGFAVTATALFEEAEVKVVTENTQLMGGE